jgi:hypothetical protein
MAGFARRISRRSLLISGMAATRLMAVGAKGNAFPSDWKRYPDPATELEVLRLTDPEQTSILPANYNRAIAKNSSFMLYSSDRDGSPQAFRMDLKAGGTKQLTEVEGLDAASLTLTPDNRSFCYFAGRALFVTSLSTLREHQLYQIPDGWERCEGMSVGPDGTHATFAERQGDGSRLRMVSLVQGQVRTVLESPFVMSDPISRPMRAQILYRHGDEALWLGAAESQTESGGRARRSGQLGGGWQDAALSESP